MKVTNKHNLPEPLVVLAKKNAFKVNVDPNKLSVSDFLKGDGEVVLTKAIGEDREIDAADQISVMLGTAIHKMIEDVTESGAEQYLSAVINGTKITGKVDFLDKENAKIHDYKTCKAKKIVDQSFEDWKEQGVAYAWLASENEIVIKSVEFHGLIKDWDKTKARFDRNYPQSPIYSYVVTVLPSDLKAFEEEAIRKSDVVRNALSTRIFPVCSEKHRWYTGTRYAVKSSGSGVDAVYDSLEQAKRHYPPGEIVKKSGRNMKCEMFCPVSDRCPFWKKINQGG